MASVSQSQIYNKPQVAYTLKKLSFFTRVLDLHAITDLGDVYSRGWAEQWNKVSSDCMAEGYPILYMAHGSTHTVAAN